MSSISDEINTIRDRLGPATSLLAVSKTRPSSMIEQAYRIEQRHFGENKVQELFDKSNELSHLSEICWHFIGHLQSNKINQLLKVKSLVSIHSIDSSKLLEKLLSKKIDRSVGLFLQLNTSGENEKGGFTNLTELESAADKIKEHNDFYLQGLMTIGKIRTERFEDDARASFQKLAQYKKDLGLDKLELSMGMSSDFEIAQEYGSNWVRIGSQIFGSRRS